MVVCAHLRTENWLPTKHVGTSIHLWGQNASTHECEGVFDAQNVLLVSGLKLASTLP